MDLTIAIFKTHAVSQMSRRGIVEADVRGVLAHPEAILDVRPGRVVAQAMAGQHLLRVFVDVDRNPPEVVTVYRTSQIHKYRSKP
jgi:hypothetical protein